MRHSPGGIFGESSSDFFTLVKIRQCFRADYHFETPVAHFWTVAATLTGKIVPTRSILWLPRPGTEKFGSFQDLRINPRNSDGPSRKTRFPRSPGKMAGQRHSVPAASSPMAGGRHSVRAVPGPWRRICLTKVFEIPENFQTSTKKSERNTKISQRKIKSLRLLRKSLREIRISFRDICQSLRERQKSLRERIKSLRERQKSLRLLRKSLREICESLRDFRQSLRLFRQSRRET